MSNAAGAPRDPAPSSPPANDASREPAKVVGLREGKETVEPQARDERSLQDGAARPAAAARAGFRWRRYARLVLMLGGIVLVLAGSAILWLRGGRYVSTDNSYVRAAKLMVSTDVSGIVAQVLVKQGDVVEAGRELFRLDPRQFEIAVKAAQAQLDQAQLAIDASRRDYQRMRTDIRTQEAVVSQARTAFERATALANVNAGSKANYDQTRFTLAAEESKLSSLRQTAQVALTRLGGDADRPIEQNPQYIEAQARVAEAQRQLDRTIVRAPFAGTVTSVESLQPGAFLVAATAALTNTGAVGLIARDNFWIEANIKETDLTYARAGNPVDIAVDAYPGRIWRGRIESIFPATTSEFSILPAQNAGGNWVKVVQRVPVRISVERREGDQPLRAGMSTVVTVDTGHRRTMRDLWALIGIAEPPVDLGFMETAAQPARAR